MFWCSTNNESNWVHSKQVTGKEVGWDKVYLETNTIPDLPKELMALHWHEEMFQIPKNAELLFSSEYLTNQGFC